MTPCVDAAEDAVMNDDHPTPNVLMYPLEDADVVFRRVENGWLVGLLDTASRAMRWTIWQAQDGDVEVASALRQALLDTFGDYMQSGHAGGLCISAVPTGRDRLFVPDQVPYRRWTHVDMVIKVLETIGHGEHIDTLLDVTNRRFGTRIDKASFAPSIYREAKLPDGRLVRQGKGIFSLRAWCDGAGRPEGG